jgi:hypothetical protein
MNKNLITSSRARRKKLITSNIFTGYAYYGDISSESVEFQTDSPFAIASDMNADGNVIVVGQSFHSSSTQVGVGVVRVYSWNGTAWVQKGGDIIPPDASSNVGAKVQISHDGNTVFLSYINNVSPSPEISFAAYKFISNAWTPVTLTQPVQPITILHDLALSGNGLTAVAVNPSRVFIFDLSTGNNVIILRPDTLISSFTSCNINYDGTVLTTASAPKPEVGFSTLVYKKINDVWTYSFGLRIGNDNNYYSAISNDGNTITAADTFTSLRVYNINTGTAVLKSLQELTAAYGGICDFNGDASMIIVNNSANTAGCVVYKWNANNNTWEKYGNNITDGRFTTRANTSKSVSINAAGTRVLISGNNYYQYDGGVNSNNFSPQVYQYNPTTLTWDKLGGPILADTMIDKPWLSADINAAGSIAAYGLSNLVHANKTRIDTDTIFPQYSKVCIYTKATNTKTYINPPNSPNDRSGFGWKIALNDAGDTFVTSTQKDVGIYVYKKTGTTWAKLGNTIASVAGSNNSVSINAAGDRVAVCRVNAVDVYAYVVGTNTWNLLGSTITAAAVKDVSLNATGDRIAVAHSAKISVYSYTMASWNLLGSQTIFNSPSPGWGHSISLNAIGDTVAVGCTDGSASVFTWNGTIWTKISKDEFAFGTNVSLNAAGDRLLIGYPTLGLAGVVGLYWWNNTEWIAVLNRRDAYNSLSYFGMQEAYAFIEAGINNGGSVCKLDSEGKKLLVGSQRRGLDYGTSPR